MIEFLCPNQHKIRCPKEKAGRPAKCPKCGVSFRIPTLEELEGKTPEAVSPAVATDGPPAPPSPGGSGPLPAAPAAKERQIEFLCPNGHHLHGPASLQGRGGECPECGSRFRIPVVDEPEPVAEALPEPEPLLEPELAAEPELLEEQITLESPPARPAPAEAEEPLGFLQVLDGSGPRLGRLAPADIVLPGEIPGLTVAASPVAGPHPLASLFMELWAQRSENSRVEVHLESGSVISPDGYLKPQSLQDYAVLVTKDPDGCSTVTVVPWGTISRIILRALKQVPGELVQ